MDRKWLPAAGVFAATLFLAGCGPDEARTAGTTEDTYSYDADRAAEETSTPETTTYDQDYAAHPDGRANEGLAGTQPADPMAQDPTATDPAAGQDVEMTEFAALDTDANGELAKEEWEASADQDLEFDDIDNDGNGSIDREEYRQNVAMSGAHSQMQSDTNIDPLN